MYVNCKDYSKEKIDELKKRIVKKINEKGILILNFKVNDGLEILRTPKVSQKLLKQAKGPNKDQKAGISQFIMNSDILSVDIKYDEMEDGYIVWEKGDAIGKKGDRISHCVVGKKIFKFELKDERYIKKIFTLELLPEIKE